MTPARRHAIVIFALGGLDALANLATYSTGSNRTAARRLQFAMTDLPKWFPGADPEHMYRHPVTGEVQS